MTLSAQQEGLLEEYNRLRAMRFALLAAMEDSRGYYTTEQWHEAVCTILDIGYGGRKW